jgi:hypothetical protein
MTKKSNLKLIFLGTFYNILNLLAKNHLKIYIDLIVEIKIECIKISKNFNKKIK